jgi:hypothetical protein
LAIPANLYVVSLPKKYHLHSFPRPAVHLPISPFVRQPIHQFIFLPTSIYQLVHLSSSMLLVPTPVFCLCGGHHHRNTIGSQRGGLVHAPNTAVQYARLMAAFRVIKPHIVARTLYGQPAKSHKEKEKRNIIRCTCPGGYL